MLIQIEYKKGFEGLNILLINKDDAVVIGDLMMGNDGSNPPSELDDLYLSAVGEAMNQMMGSAATSLFGEMFKKEIDIMPPIVKLKNLKEIKIENDFFVKNNEFVVVEFSMKIEGLVDTSIFQIMDRKQRFCKRNNKRDVLFRWNERGDASSQNKKNRK